MAKKKIDAVALERSSEKEFNKKIKKIKKSIQKSGVPNKATTGTIYLGHIPHGFFEPQMRAYFSQFGKIRRLRLARSVKTGKSKGFAFIEFTNDKVASIAAEAMNNYLMFEKILKSHVVSADKLHKNMFMGSGITCKMAPGVKRSRLAIKQNNKGKTEKAETRGNMKRHKALDKTKGKLAELGIQFDFPLSKPKRIRPIKSKVEEVEVDKEETETGFKTTMVIDEEELEVEFKTPPNTVKIVKSRQQLVKPSQAKKKKRSLTTNKGGKIKFKATPHTMKVVKKSLKPFRFLQAEKKMRLTTKKGGEMKRKLKK